MTRLLQGDVGSGKTIVAAVALLIAVASGYQAALMAPTEILAEQHHRTLVRVRECAALSGELLGRPLGWAAHQRIEEALTERPAYQGAASGAVDVLVGTQAIIQEGLGFSKPGARCR